MGGHLEAFLPVLEEEGAPLYSNRPGKSKYVELGKWEKSASTGFVKAYAEREL